MIESQEAQPSIRTKLFLPFTWLVIVAGTLVVVYAALRLPVSTLDLRFAVLAAITLGITSRIVINLSRFKSAISVSDTLIFLTLLLYGGEATILLTAAEGLIASSRFCKRKFTVAFNSAALALATFINVSLLRWCFGQDVSFDGNFHGSFISAICLMALVQYAANSGLVALAASLNTDRPFLHTWHKHFLWTSITYFAGASSAGIIAMLLGVVGTSALVVSAPIIFIVYFTYRTYLQNVESSAAQAEQAERHVAELSHYIAEQERIREQFSQIEKLSALGELASGVAHDFNNTLTGILGRAQLIMRTDDPEKIRRGLQIIVKAAEDGAKTVKRIQNFARQRQARDLEPVSVDQLLFDVSEITRPRWHDRGEASGTHVVLELQNSSKAVVMGEGSELREVLVNMVFNALDAMPEGGRLTLTAEQSDGFVCIGVRDTGTGMSPEVRSRIFDPFFTTKGEGGLGLGLAVSYGIVRRHEGTIEVESQEGAGTTISIRLPAAKHASASARTGSEATASTLRREPLRRLRLLVVDDEPSVRELLRDLLESEGHAVELASNAFEALALFRAMKFDIIFTDIGMPGMSGWELARAIREIDAEVPLAVITGWGDAVGSEKQKSAGVDGVVTKPFSAERIVELTEELAGRVRVSHANLSFAATGNREPYSTQPTLR
ncbi:MAG: response regulator [Acidobacteria bacterium]|nr:response regulator [Acidobacteriota bacterium]